MSLAAANGQRRSRMTNCWIHCRVARAMVVAAGTSQRCRARPSITKEVFTFSRFALARPRGRSHVAHIDSTYVLFSPEASRCPTRRDQRVGGRRRVGPPVLPSPSPTRVTGGFLYKLGGVSYTIRILMYPACILHVSCMYFDVPRSYTSGYIKIHRDTTRYICICHFSHQRKCILPRDMYPSLRYIQDTFKIHLRYIVS
jgi:hypothetical protein